MRFKILIIVSLLTCLFFPFNSYAIFIAKRENLKSFYTKPNVVMIASTGRSGSSMLTKQIQLYVPHHSILKTHLLPPDSRFKGKIIFIFSNPDQAAESALYMTLHNKSFEESHFNHVETADREWWKKMGGAHNQTEQDNLLSYDALGIYEHLKVWLYDRTKPSDLENAQILAIKFEHLWEERTLEAIKSFLGISHFKLPPQRARGHKKENFFPQEKSFRKMYNLGTETDPRYAAYADAKILWEEAPSFQFLEILPH